MGQITYSYNTTVVDNFKNSVLANTTQYYGFIAISGEKESVDPISNTNYDIVFTSNWKTIAGKKLSYNDITHVIEKNIWSSNTVYRRYDNTDEQIFSSKDFYVITEPNFTGGSYNVYKCIDNANGSPSTINPSSIGDPKQPNTFKTADNYKWRYITSINEKNYEKFATDNYVPISKDLNVVSSAEENSGIDIVVISNSGVGYAAYNNGVVQSQPNSTIIQIESSASESNDFYNLNSIYLYNSFNSTSQMLDVGDYIVNSSGKWVRTTTSSNVFLVTPGVTNYIISPKVVFETDGDIEPVAYSVVNAVSNSISEIVIIEPGRGVSWANTYIQTNENFGSGCVIYSTTPPPGGHGSDPASELNCKGMALGFSFSNTESNNIVTSNVIYNRVGVIRDPYSLVANSETGEASKGTRYYESTFDQTYQATISTPYVFQQGEIITGETSGSKASVVFSNTSVVYFAGDKTFIDGEFLFNGNNEFTTSITLTKIPDIYTKENNPLYLDNINSVYRAEDQTENYKLIITF